MKKEKPCDYVTNASDLFMQSFELWCSSTGIAKLEAAELCKAAGETWDKACDLKAVVGKAKRRSKS